MGCDKQSESGWTALHQAVDKGDVTSVRTLLDRARAGSMGPGAGPAAAIDVNAKGKGDCNFGGLDWTPLHHAVEKGDLDALAAILDYDRSVRRESPDAGGVGVDVNAEAKYEDYAQWTPLHHAVERSDVHVVSALLDHDKYLRTLSGGTSAQGGININAKGQYAAGGHGEYDGHYEWTPLHHAVEKGNIAVLEALLKHDRYLRRLPGDESGLGAGLDINAKSKYDYYYGGYGHDEWTPLHHAVEKGNRDVLCCLLEHDKYLRELPGGTSGLDVNAPAKHYGYQQCFNWTPLHHAVEKGNRDILELLIEHQQFLRTMPWTCQMMLNPRGKNRDRKGDWTPLHHAVLKRYRHFLQILLEAVASLVPEEDAQLTQCEVCSLDEKSALQLEEDFGPVGSALREALLGGFKDEVVNFLCNLRLAPINLRTQIITTLQDCGKRVTPDSTKVANVVCRACPEASVVDVWNDVWWPRKTINDMTTFLEQRLLTSTWFIGGLLVVLVLTILGLGFAALIVWALVLIFLVGFKVSVMQLLDPSGQQSVAAHVVVIPGLSNYTTFRVLIEHGAYGSVEIFDNPTVKALITSLWDQVSMRFYLRAFAYVAFVLLFSTFSVNVVGSGESFESLRNETSQPFFDKPQSQSFVIGCVAQILNLYFLFREFRKAAAAIVDSGLIKYVEFWNVLQLSGSALVVTTFWMYVRGSDNVELRIVGSVAGMLVWLNILYFLKAFKSISFLIESLVTIMKDMTPFLTVVTVLLLSVVVAYQTLLSNMAVSPEFSIEAGDDPTNPFGAFLPVLFKVTRIAEGRLDVEDYEFADSRLKVMYFVYFIMLAFVITVVALNALIALMNGSYEKVTEKRVQQRYKLLAQIVLDEMRVMPSTKSKEFRAKTRWIHVLSPSSDGASPDAGHELWDGMHRDEISGGLVALKLDLKRLREDVTTRLDALTGLIRGGAYGSGFGVATQGGAATVRRSVATRTGAAMATLSASMETPAEVARRISLRH